MAKAIGIFNGIRNSYYQDYLRGVQTTILPHVTERTPKEEIEFLESEIADEQETIRAFGSSRVALDAKGRIAHLELEIEKWKAVIYAAEQEAFDRAMRAAAIYPMYFVRRAWWVNHVREVVGR